MATGLDQRQRARRPPAPAAGGLARLRRSAAWPLWRDRFLASDPGLIRLRLAVHGAVGISAAIGAERLLSLATGRSESTSLVAMLLGAVVAMQSALGLAGRTRGIVRVSFGFPLAMSLGLVAGAFLAGRGPVPLVVFVVVQFAAVWVRRFGQPFFVYGFMGWMGYFFASLLQVPVAELGELLEEVLISSAVVLLLSMTVLRYRPETLLARLISGFDARGRAVAAAAGDLLERSARGSSRPPPPAADPLGRRLHSRLVKLTEAALMADAAISETGALPVGWRAEALRSWLIDTQLAIEQLATASALMAAACAGEPADCALAARARAALDAAGEGQPERVRREAALLDADARRADGAARQLACPLAAAACSYASALARGPAVPGPRPADGAGKASGPDEAGGRPSKPVVEPVVTLAMGALPGTAAVAGGVVPRGREWNPLRRASLVTRQALQAAVSAGLAILAGRAVSEQRYYWAVIASFVIFAGTSTRGETLQKGGSRVVGTLAGIFVSLAVADATVGNTAAILLVIVLSMFGSLYLQRVSYASMVFFITIMLGELYSILDELSGGLLVLRLEETAVGAAIAVAVAVVFVPVSTRDTARAARTAFFDALAALLGCSASLLGNDGLEPEPAGGGPGAERRFAGRSTAAAQASLAAPGGAGGPSCRPGDLDPLARRLDLCYRQLELVLRPRTRSSLFGADPERLRQRLGRYLLCTSSARELAVVLREELPEDVPREVPEDVPREVPEHVPREVPEHVTAHVTARPQLGRAASALAAASEALGAGEGSGAARQAAEEALDEAGAALGEAAVAAALPAALPAGQPSPQRGEPAGDVVERGLTRLLLLLRALAGLDPPEAGLGTTAISATDRAGAGAPAS